MPVAVRVHFAHAAVQAIADAVGADLLHVKGPAIDPSLRPPVGGEAVPRRAAGGVPAEPRLSTDADVLVRPGHAPRLLAALRRHGWAVRTRFETGSAFEHAATLWHEQLGYVDVHRWFPGIELPPDEGFAWLWQHRQRSTIAHRECPVPSVDAQRLLLILHGARSGGLDHPDVVLLWALAAPAEREHLRGLAADLHAEVALAAATGDLDAYADHPSHDLWQSFAEPSDAGRLGEWRARLKAAPTLAARVRVLARALLVNTDHLAMRLQRRPTRAEVLAEYLRRSRAGVHALAGWARRTLRR